MINPNAFKEPEMVSHYVSQAIARAGLSLEAGFKDDAESSREKLISQLELLDESFGSKEHYDLSRKCLEYLYKQNGWANLDNVQNFLEEYGMLKEKYLRS